MNSNVTTEVQRSFEARYGRRPLWIASAPGRVNLIGEFTDYNDGFVLPMALAQRTVVAAAPNGSSRIVVYSSANGETDAIDTQSPIAPDSTGRWTNYVRGVLAGFIGVGVKLQGFDAVIGSDVPIGAGLSSSAALEVAFATLVEGLHGVRLDPVEKALLCQQAEHNFAGVPCGIMDPFIATLGRADHAMFLDCRSRQPEWLPLADPSVTVLVVNTHVKHQLATSAYALRRQECQTAVQALSVPSLREASFEMLARQADRMDGVIVRRARHVIGEIARTAQASRCIRERNWTELGQLLNASHESLQNNYEVSCPELDAVVAIAQDIGISGGVYGCRMTGGGFGGCTVALIQADRQERVAQTIRDEYQARTGIAASVFASRPGDGAQLLAA